jgi:hypothetical protein
MQSSSANPAIELFNLSDGTESVETRDNESINECKSQTSLQTQKCEITDMNFHEHEKRWAEMCEDSDVSFSSALRYLRVRMFVDRNMLVIVDESQLRQLALALYRYRSGDIDESIQDKEFISNMFDWGENLVFDPSVSGVL